MRNVIKNLLRSETVNDLIGWNAWAVGVTRITLGIGNGIDHGQVTCLELAVWVEGGDGWNLARIQNLGCGGSVVTSNSYRELKEEAV